MIYTYLTDMIALREPESRIAYVMTIVLCIQCVRLRKSIRHYGINVFMVTLQRSVGHTVVDMSDSLLPIVIQLYPNDVYILFISFVANFY